MIETRRLKNVAIFIQTILCFVLSRRIWKYYCHIWIQRHWVCLATKFGEKIEILKFGIKNALFGYFWTRILKNYCHIWNQLPPICLIAKFSRKTKMSKFGTKYALFGYFWARTFKIYWNQHLWICLIV